MAKTEAEMKAEIIQVLKSFSSIPMDRLQALAERIRGLPVKDIRDASKLEERTSDLGLDAETVREGLPAVMAFHRAAAREKSSLAHEIREFASDALDQAEVAALDQFATSAQAKLDAVVKDFESTLAPSVPFDEYKGMFVRVISITEFDKEFGWRDDLDKYEPTVEAQHPRVIVTLKLGEDRKQVPFIANSQNLEHMISFLQFAQKQLACVTSAKQED